MTYQDLLNSEELTLKTYRDSPAYFQTLTSWQKAALAVVYPSLMLEMVKDKKDLNILLTAHSDVEAPYLHAARDKISRLRYRPALEVDHNEAVATLIYEDQELFSRLEYNVALILPYPALQKRIVTDNRLQNLADTEFHEQGLSYFVTRTILVPEKTDEQALNHRNALCIAIANQPHIILRLLPMTRLFLLSALKSLPPEQKANLPKYIQEALDFAYELPLQLKTSEMEGFFVLRSLAGFPRGNDYLAKFHNQVMEYALQEYPYIPNQSAEALSLAIVQDQRFQKGYPNEHFPDHPFAKLKITEWLALVEKHQLFDKIAAYQKLTKALSEEIKTQDENRHIPPVNSSQELINQYVFSTNEFKALSNFKKALLAIKHPILAMAMIQNEESLDAILKPVKSADDEHSEYAWRLQFTPAIVPCAVNSKEVATSLFDKPKLFNSLEWNYNIEMVLVYPGLTKRMVFESRLQDLNDIQLSSFVTCITVKASRPSYGKNLSDNERDALSAEIAKHPEIIIRLFPAARLLLLARIKQLPPVLQETLPKFVQEAAENAYNFSLDVEAFGNAFWIHVLGGMTYENDLGRFSDMMNCATRQHNYQNVSLQCSEACALILMLDPRFEKGLPNAWRPECPLSKIKLEQKQLLIRTHHLSEKISAYNLFSENLKSLSSSSSPVISMQPSSDLMANQNESKIGAEEKEAETGLPISNLDPSTLTQNALQTTITSTQIPAETPLIELKYQEASNVRTGIVHDSGDASIINAEQHLNALISSLNTGPQSPEQQSFPTQLTGNPSSAITTQFDTKTVNANLPPLNKGPDPTQGESFKFCNIL